MELMKFNPYVNHVIVVKKILWWWFKIVIVDGNVTIDVHKRIEKEIANEPTQDELENEFLSNGDGEVVAPDVEFTKPNGRKRKGFYLDGYLKKNIDDYLIKGVKKKFDGIFLCTGIEGASKSTNAFTIGKYIDPTFPGEPLNDGTTRRSCDRIVFTPQQLLEAIDSAKAEQVIVLDEAILSFMSQDSSSDIQKMLIKKMVTIRSLRLYIIIVIPSIFLLRRYMAVFRTRFLIHYYCPDGITRGYAKVYSYETKRKLYLRGIKEFDQDCVKPDFRIRATDTSGFFFSENEYQLKKNNAVKEITTAGDKKKEKNSKVYDKCVRRLSILIYGIHKYFKSKDTKHTTAKTKEIFDNWDLDIPVKTITNYCLDAKKYISEKAEEIAEKQQLDDNIAIQEKNAEIEKLKKKLAKKEGKI